MFTLQKVFILLLGISIGWFLAVFILEIKKHLIDKKEKEKSDKDSELADFLVNGGLKQFDLNKNDGVARLYWIKKWKEKRIPERIFNSFEILLPIYFRESFLGSNNYLLNVVGHSYEEGWFDIVISKRHKEDLPIRLHYYDLVVFNEGCNKVIGFDMSITTELSRQVLKTIKKYKEDKAKEDDGNS